MHACMPCDFIHAPCLHALAGSYKYVCMRLRDAEGSEGAGGPRSKLLVWGDARAPYHNDLLQKAKAAVGAAVARKAEERGEWGNTRQGPP